MVRFTLTPILDAADADQLIKMGLATATDEHGNRLLHKVHSQPGAKWDGPDVLRGHYLLLRFHCGENGKDLGRFCAQVQINLEGDLDNPTDVHTYLCVSIP
ncbi:hypothetical protein ACHAQC_004219 [Fusarium culmorum]